MRKLFYLAVLVIAAMTFQFASADDRSWDFTSWSDETLANLEAESAIYNAYYDSCGSVMTGTLWRSYEKEATYAEYDGFYFYGTEITSDEGVEITANDEVIAELAGLYFTKVGASNFAIAVDYDSTSLGTYQGGAYLWLGGASSKSTNNKFIIPDVAAGSTITIGIESHKNSDGRGVILTIDDETVLDLSSTKTYTESSVTLGTTETKDIVVYNTNGCHLYFITVEEPESDSELSYVSPEEETPVTELSEVIIGVAEDFTDYSINTAVVDDILVYSKLGGTFGVSEVSQNDDNNIVITLDSVFTEDITITVVIPEGLVYTEGHVNPATAFYYQVSESAGITYEFTLTPADGETVSQLDSIMVYCEAASILSTNWNHFNGDVLITDEAGETVASITTTYEPYDWDSNVGYNYMYLILDEAITAAGTYTLTIPAGAIYINDAAAENTEEITATYIVEGTTDEESDGSSTTVLLTGTTLPNANDEYTDDDGTTVVAKNEFSGSDEYGTEGFSIAITGNRAKTLNAQGTVTVDGTAHTGIKCSNGAQNTLYFPDDVYVTNVTIYAYANADELTKDAYWKEFNGVTYTVDDNDYNTTDSTDPGVASFDLDNVTGSVTFTNTGLQPIFVMSVTYNTGDDTETGISTVNANAVIDATINVYNLSGMKVMSTTNAADINNLSKGLYIINGKKVVIK